MTTNLENRFMPEWLSALSVASLSLAAVCAVVIAADLLRHPQKMWIMNIVWPITALYAGPLAVIGYYRAGRLSSKQSIAEEKVNKNPAIESPSG